MERNRHQEGADLPVLSRRGTSRCLGGGQVRFQGLEKGIYLVTAQAPAGAAAGEDREISPFLVAVPVHTVADTPRPVEGVIVAKTNNTVPPNTPPTGGYQQQYGKEPPPGRG